MYCATIICSSVVMQNMASWPFYLLLVVSLNFLSSNAKPVSLLDKGENQGIINLLLIQNDIRINS